MPTVNEGEEANCRILPLCSEAGTGDCFASPTGLAQKPQNLPIVDVSSLPVCNGTNGEPGIDCKAAGGLTQNQQSLI